MANTPLTIRIPVRGKVLIKLDGFDDVHEVGAFTKDINVGISTAGGNVDFRFDEKFWEETIQDRGVAAPTPTAGRAAASIVEEVLHNGGVKLEGPLAVQVVEALEREGLLK